MKSRSLLRSFPSGRRNLGAHPNTSAALNRECARRPCQPSILQSTRIETATASNYQRFFSSTSDFDDQDKEEADKNTGLDLYDVDDYGSYEDRDPDYADYNKKYDGHHKEKRNYDDIGAIDRRIWLDPSTRLEDRVSKVLERNLGTLHPLDITLASVDLIRECGKLKSFEGMKYGHDILDRLLEEKRHVNLEVGRPLVVIPERVFKTLMYGWSNLSKEVSFAPQRMREILDTMIQETEYDEQIKAERQSTTEVDTDAAEDHDVFDQKQDHIFAGMSCQPTVDIYNTMLQGLAEASYRSIASAGEAEDILRKMDRIHRARGWHTKPTNKSFTLVINAFARTCHYTAGDRAEGVLRAMSKYSKREKQAYLEEKGFDYDPSDHSVNTRRIVAPDAKAYAAAIQAHTQSDSEGSAQKALDLLFEMIQSDDETLQLDAFVFANTIHAFAKTAAKKRSASGRIAAAERSEEILWLMVDEIKRQKEAVANNTEKSEDSETGDDNKNEVSQETGVLVANVIPFNACLNAWARSEARDSAPCAEELLHKMLDPEIQAITQVTPDTVSFNACLHAWARASRKDPAAPQKAEELLTLMADLQLDTAKPDVHSYTSVMNAYGQSNLPDKTAHARRILVTLIANTKTRGDKKISAVPFTVLLNAAAHSPNVNAALDDVSNMDAFAAVDDQHDAYTIALETYRELREDLHDLKIAPDHIAFSTVLDVIAQHTDPDSIERRQRVEEVFEDACAAGHVSSLVVQALHKACPSTDMFLGLLRNRKALSMQTVNALPREWTRSVAPKFRKVDLGGRGSSEGRPKRKPNHRRGDKKHNENK
jgi:hypothetical protein